VSNQREDELREKLRELVEKGWRFAAKNLAQFEKDISADMERPGD
jgi:hypothetical protein